MCGINGIYGLERINDPKKVMIRMNQSIEHRGPDATGIYQSDNIILGHQRLKIIDLSGAANQPFTSSDGNYVLVFNGEIYNFLELKSTILKGHQFKSNSDTEVLLKLYELKGIDFLEVLNGDFAISILDKKAAKLYVIRDRVGVKPLYYFSNSEDFIYGSEIKSILAAGIPSQLNKEQLQEYFTFV